MTKPLDPVKPLEESSDEAEIDAMKRAEVPHRWGSGLSIIASVILIIVAVITALWTTGANIGPALFWIRGQSNQVGGVESVGEVPAPPSQTQCALSIIDPPADSDIPAIGPMTLHWTDVVDSSRYSFEVSPPAGSGAPWILSAEGTSKTIYMENFPAAGEYGVTVNALAESGDVLCTTRISFTKAATDLTGGKDKDAGGSGCFDPNNVGCP